MSALATALKLEIVAGALQNQFGYARMVVNAAMLPASGDALRMLLVVQQPHWAPEQIEVTQADGARLRGSGSGPILR